MTKVQFLKFTKQSKDALDAAQPRQAVCSKGFMAQKITTKH